MAKASHPNPRAEAERDRRIRRWIRKGESSVAWVFPNYLRQAALQIVSSNVHYYEDVRGVREETQVLRPFFFWSLQVFCFNFGTTHSFHHSSWSRPST